MSENSPKSNWVATVSGENGITARYGLAACAAQDGYIYCYGGMSNEDGTGFFNDLRRFQVNSEGAVQWELLDSSELAPEGREGHGLLAVGPKLYLVGGATEEEDSRFAPHVYCYSLDAGSWEKVETMGSPPMGTNPTYSAIEEKVFVFGGIFDGVPSNSVFMLDLIGLKWTELECSGKLPAPRCDHAACHIGNCIYVFGGSGGEDLFHSDVFQLDLSTLTWSEVELTGQSPEARDYPTMVSYGREGIVMTGGSKDDKALPGTYYINLQEKEWVLMEPEGDPPTSRFGHAAVVQKCQMVVLAGSSTAEDDEKDLDDVCVLCLPDTPAANASYEPTELPTNHLAAVPQPAKRRNFPAPKLVTARDYEDTKQVLLKSITETFEAMVDHFLKLDQEREDLRVEKVGLEDDKRQFEKLQKEHKELVEKQQRTNDAWLSGHREENDRERQDIANEKEWLTQERAKLEQERKTFDEKSKKLEAIMTQFKGMG